MPRVTIRSNSIRIPQEDMWRAPLSGLPQGEAHDTREYHTPDDSISYLDMLFGSLTKASKPCYVILTACHKPCSAAIRWCVRMPCPDIFCSLHSWFAYGKGLQSFGSSCFWAFHCFAMDSLQTLLGLGHQVLKIFTIYPSDLARVSRQANIFLSFFLYSFFFKGSLAFYKVSQHY